MGINEFLDRTKDLSIGKLFIYLLAWFVFNTLLSVAKQGIKSYKNRHKILEIHLSDLKNHHLFCQIELWSNLEINLIGVNPIKYMLVNDYSKIRLKFIRESIYNFISNNSIKQYSSDRLYMEISTTVLLCIKKYNDYAISYGIPKLFIEKYNKWSGNNLRHMIDDIEAVVKCNLMTNNVLKLVSVLNVISSAIGTSMSNLEKAINEINGELKNEEYLGKKIGV